MNKFARVLRPQTKLGKVRRAMAVGVGLASAAAASAFAEMDVTPVVTAIGAVTASVILIGNADLLVRVGVKAFSYVRSALGR